jgi:hypothetical protein
VAENDEVPRIPGIRAISGFYRNFGGEDVVVRPKDPGSDPFKVEVLLNGNKAVLPPEAPVREGDVMERADPRGGVIEYLISRYEFSRDPFGHGNDHWDATLTEKGHASRSFAQPNIIVHGGSNQISIGDSNHLQQSNTAVAREVIAALEEIEKSAPTDQLEADQVEALQDALSDAKTTASTAKKPTAVKRSLYGLRGVVDEIGSSAEAGAKDAVKAWVAAATTSIITHLAGL